MRGGAKAFHGGAGLPGPFVRHFLLSQHVHFMLRARSLTRWAAEAAILLADVSLGEVGAVLALEVSRLARSNTDWHRLIELCSLTGTLILDEDGVYDPADFNDALLLGIKGTMSAAELHFLRGRLQGGKRNKAERGELRFPLPVGLCWDEAGGIVLDPDQEVQGAVRTVFRFFQETGSAYGVAHWFAEKGLKFPKRAYGGVWNGKLIWGHLTDSRVLTILKNPAYAGMYVFGRFRCVKEILQDGQIRQRVRRCPATVGSLRFRITTKTIPVGTSTWPTRTDSNATSRSVRKTSCRRRPAKVWRCCRDCWSVERAAAASRCVTAATAASIRFTNATGASERADRRSRACPCPVRRWTRPSPSGCLPRSVRIRCNWRWHAQEELSTRDGSLRRQWDMRLQRAQYEADLAQRRYEQVDPDNRLVAASLESRWNVALVRKWTRSTDSGTNSAGSKLAPLPKSNASESWPWLTTSRVCGTGRPRVPKIKSGCCGCWSRTSPSSVARTASSISIFVGQAARCEDLAVTLPAKVQDRLRYPAKRIKEIRQLATKHTDAQIAELLNNRGQRSSRGKPFTAKMIGWIRYKHRIATVELKRHDEFTVTELATQFNVSPGVVYYWIEHGILPAHEQAANRPYWITLHRSQSPGTANWVQSSKRIAKPSMKRQSA